MTNQRISKDSTGDNIASSVPLGRKFAPHAGLSILALVVMLLTAKLGFWQWGRGDEKLQLQAQFDAMSVAPALTHLTQSPERYQRVNLSGKFDTNKSLLHDNQIHASRPGLHAYAVFLPSDGAQAVLVNRGWFALPAERKNIASPPLPAAQTTLVGRINMPAQRTKRLADHADSATLAQTIDLTALRAQWAIPLAPFIIEQTQGDDGLIRQWLAPDFKIDTHRMYAGQWFCFSILTFVLWIVYSFKKGSPK